MQVERFDQIAAQFSKKRLLVIGDLMLDEFVWGRVSRISPEAPVPVVEVLRRNRSSRAGPPMWRGMFVNVAPKSTLWG